MGVKTVGPQPSDFVIIAQLPNLQSLHLPDEPRALSMPTCGGELPPYSVGVSHELRVHGTKCHAPWDCLHIQYIAIVSLAARKYWIAYDKSRLAEPESARVSQSWPGLRLHTTLF